jgi:hypothetical protein
VCAGETGVFRACARFLHEDTMAQGVRFGVLPGLSLAGLPAEQVRADLRALAFGWMDVIAARSGKPRWAEKTGVATFHVETLERWLGDSVRYVAMLRHGLDTACSLVELAQRSGGYLEELHAYLRSDPRPIRAMVRAWVDTTNAVVDLAQRRPDVLVVRYEDLVRQPNVELAQLFAGLGETWDPEWLAHALTRPGTPGLGDWKTWERTAIDARSVERWRALDPATISDLTPLANPALERAGYAPVDVHPTPDADRRVALAHRLAALKTEGT